MRPLRELRYDDAISDPVVRFGLGDDAEEIPLTHALRIATERGVHLIQEFDSDDGVAYCSLQALAIPPRWEDAEPTCAPFDPALWFTSARGCRDFLMGRAYSQTPGRIAAWCPHVEREYRNHNVGLSDLTAMSEASRYFVAGVLAASVPRPPEDEDDVEAWFGAADRFRRATGSWAESWRVCADCGAVLLPSNPTDRCAHHAPR